MYISCPRLLSEHLWARHPSPAVAVCAKPRRSPHFPSIPSPPAPPTGGPQLADPRRGGMEQLAAASPGVNISNPVSMAAVLNRSEEGLESRTDLSGSPGGRWHQ